MIPTTESLHDSAVAASHPVSAVRFDERGTHRREDRLETPAS
jgi:hypothetical protein